MSRANQGKRTMLLRKRLPQQHPNTMRRLPHMHSHAATWRASRCLSHSIASHLRATAD
jgi:hypothetical protein